VAKGRRPRPYRVDAFAHPDDQAKQICNLLLNILKSSMKKDAGSGKTKLEELIDAVAAFQQEIVNDSQSEIDQIERLIALELGKVFPDYVVKFDAKPEDDLTKVVNPFRAETELRMGRRGQAPVPVRNQGSGARRTLLWTALKVQADIDAGRTPIPGSSNRAGLLLIDEPEICLHPSAIRDAANVLYELPNGHAWQVMATTHCPVFIDLSKDNTTIVRVEQTTEGEIHTTTLFRPSSPQLDADDKHNLKLLNLFDPYVAEFFFGGRSIIVEGDTEYAVMKYVVHESSRPELKGVQIIRARGKATVASLAKILNQFGAPYAVLHDSDSPTINAGKQRNPAWTLNSRIRTAIEQAPAIDRVRHLVTIDTFEFAFFGSRSGKDKPYAALEIVQGSSEHFKTMEDMLLSLLTSSAPPPGAVVWEDLDALEAAYHSQASARLTGVAPPDKVRVAG
jgi:putative ATP-dependent endonuclease of OLD family